MASKKGGSDSETGKEGRKRAEVILRLLRVCARTSIHLSDRGFPYFWSHVSAGRGLAPVLSGEEGWASPPHPPQQTVARAARSTAM